MRALCVWTKGSGQSATTPTAEAAASLARRRYVLARLDAAGREAGMTTAEYAVGTVAACGFAGVLYKVLTRAMWWSSC
jgi:hypothetical protein